MEAFLIIATLFSAGLAVVFLNQLRDARRRLQLVHRGATQVDDRLEALRKELGNAKEELQKKTKALETAKDEARKKARREGKKAKAEEQARDKADAPRTDDGNDAESKRLKKALAAVEQQLATLRAEADTEKAQAVEEAKAELASALADSQEKAEASQQRLDELRATIKRKEDSRPAVPGSSLDLKALPKEAVEELARYYRKGEEFERLYGVSQGKLLLSQERQQELQRRYYAVCRELALLAGSSASENPSDEEAREIAETVVNQSDAAMAGQQIPVPSKNDTSEKTEPAKEAQAQATESAEDIKEADVAASAAMPVEPPAAAEASPEA